MTGSCSWKFMPGPPASGVGVTAMVAVVAPSWGPW
eukprot:CAMPEP_0117499724 /NCGR_PEP_ID=MMETSP0784-20121206/22393_1 /TAXON_ID=39447 /ORGANISM="" /LENGTH=34 /DNA_ID= /DNA_START= /DNA_END= /DNA_ORIENTATION=